MSAPQPPEGHGWSDQCPTDPGVYEFCCNEDDYTPTAVELVGENLRGDFDCGGYDAKHVHEGVTNPRWRKLPAASEATSYAVKHDGVTRIISEKEKDVLLDSVFADLQPEATSKTVVETFGVPIGHGGPKLKPLSEATRESTAAEDERFQERAMQAFPVRAVPAGAAGECVIPPTGWKCTREAGHGGPCAAVPIDSFPECAIDLKRLYEAMPPDLKRKVSCHDLKRTVDAYNRGASSGGEITRPPTSEERRHLPVGNDVRCKATPAEAGSETPRDVDYSIVWLKQWAEDVDLPAFHLKRLIAGYRNAKAELAEVRRVAGVMASSLKQAEKQINILAENGTDRIKFLGGDCDPWNDTAEITIRRSGIKDALSEWEKLQPGEGR